MNRIGRRAALQVFGGALLSLPVLEACTNHESPLGRARSRLSGPPAKRFVAIMAPNGIAPRLWWPTDKGETSFELNSSLEPHAKHKDSMILLRGVDNVAGGSGQHKNGHIEGVTAMLTGRETVAIDASKNQFTAGGPSIDQLIARDFSARGTVTKAKSIHFGEEGTGGYSSISYEDARQPTGTFNSASKALGVLFEDPKVSAEALAKARALRKSVLDGSRSDYERLASRVSGEDKKRIDAHLAAIRDLELRLNAPTCSPGGVTFPAPKDDGERRTQYYEIAALALACDVTRVATFSFRHSGGGGPQLPFLEVYEDIHELSHKLPAEKNATDSAHVRYDKYLRWYEGAIVAFVDRLRSIKTAEGGTLFDETVILRGSEIGYDHSWRSIPFYLLAGKDTPFRTGRYLELPNVPHNHLLTTVLRAFAVDASSAFEPQHRGDLDDRLLK